MVLPLLDKVANHVDEQMLRGGEMTKHLNRVFDHCANMQLRVRGPIARADPAEKLNGTHRESI